MGVFAPPLPYAFVPGTKNFAMPKALHFANLKYSLSDTFCPNLVSISCRSDIVTEMPRVGIEIPIYVHIKAGNTF